MLEVPDSRERLRPDVRPDPGKEAPCSHIRQWQTAPGPLQRHGLPCDQYIPRFRAHPMCSTAMPIREPYSRVDGRILATYVDCGTARSAGAWVFRCLVYSQALLLGASGDDRNDGGTEERCPRRWARVAHRGPGARQR